MLRNLLDQMYQPNMIHVMIMTYAGADPSLALTGKVKCIYLSHPHPHHHTQTPTPAPAPTPTPIYVFKEIVFLYVFFLIHPE